MLKVLFFARVREQLGCDQLHLEWPENGLRLDELQEALCAEHGDLWRATLGENNLIRAVNQTVVEDNCTLADGDEVAFFPPVTGG